MAVSSFVLSPVAGFMAGRWWISWWQMQSSMHFWSSLSRLMTSGKSWRPSDSGWAGGTQVADSPHLGRGNELGFQDLPFRPRSGLSLCFLSQCLYPGLPLCVSSSLGPSSLLSWVEILVSAQLLPGLQTWGCSQVEGFSILLRFILECQTTPFGLRSVSVSQGNTRQSWTSICQRPQGVEEFGGVWERVAYSGGVWLFLCLWGPMAKAAKGVLWPMGLIVVWDMSET